MKIGVNELELCSGGSGGAELKHSGSSCRSSQLLTSRKVILQIAPPIIRHDILPLGRSDEVSQIRLQRPAQNFEGRRLSYPVRSEEAEDAAGTRVREAVDLETVGTVAVGGVGFEVGGELYDAYGVAGTLLRPVDACWTRLEERFEGRS